MVPAVGNRMDFPLPQDQFVLISRIVYVMKSWLHAQTMSCQKSCYNLLLKELFYVL